MGKRIGGRGSCDFAQDDGRGASTFREPVIGKPVMREPVIGKPVVRKPVMREPHARACHPQARHLQAGHPQAGHARACHRQACDPQAGHPARSGAESQDPPLGKRIGGRGSCDFAQDDGRGASTFREPLIGKPVVRKPVMREPVIGKPVISKPVILRAAERSRRIHPWGSVSAGVDPATS
ncbi:MAG: hypothetical protein ACJ8G1_20740, partial [Vitreoscilla sp.]